MDAIIEEFIPPADAFKLTEAFMPMKNVNDEDLISMVNAGVFGMTNPVALGGDHIKIGMPTFYYKEHRAGYWRESIVFDEEVLQRVKQPSKPTVLWGEGLVGAALNTLDLRLNTLIEFLTASTIAVGKFSIAKNGVAYTYDSKIPPKYYVYTGLAASKPSTGVGWTAADWKTGAANDLWSGTGTAMPLDDIRHFVEFFARQGYSADELWMSRKVAGYLEDNTTASGIRAFIVANPGLAGKMITAESIILAIGGLKGMKPIVDDRRYLEEAGITAPTIATGTTLYVTDTGGFAASDIVTVRDPSALTEEDCKIESISTSAKTITLATRTPLVYAVTVGSRITNSKLFMPETDIWLRGKGNARVSHANWISTPSLVKAKSYKNPLPGRYTWRTFNDRVPYWVETGAGINGGPVIHAPGNWCVLRVV